MIGAAIQNFCMDVCLGASCEAFEEIVHELRLQVSNQPNSYLGVHNHRRAAAKVDCRQPERREEQPEDFALHDGSLAQMVAVTSTVRIDCVINSKWDLTERPQS